MKHSRSHRILCCLLLVTLLLLFGLTACREKGEKGDPGEQGVSIVKTELIDGELIVTYSDGRKENLGVIAGESDPNVAALSFYLLPDETYGVMAKNADYLYELSIPASYNGRRVTQILNNAFKNLENLKTVNLPHGLTVIGANAFEGCTSLENITVPGSITAIEDGAFFHCSGLKTVVLEEGVTAIGNFAFQRCTGLTGITIPSSMTQIGQTAFLNCYRLVEVINHSALTIEKGSSENGYIAYYALNVHSQPTSQLVNQDGYCFLTVKEEHYLVEYTGNETDLVLPTTYRDALYQINQYAFYDGTQLTSVVIPATVTAIGDYAFAGCSALTKIAVPSSVTKIGQYAFSKCTALNDITVSDSVRQIGQGAFSETGYENDSDNWEKGLLYLNCHLIAADNALKTAVLAKNVLTIADHTFASCIDLTEITLPASLKVIGDSAFAHCTRLGTIEYKNTKETWDTVQKGTEWDAEVAYYTVKCTDGNITSSILKP